MTNSNIRYSSFLKSQGFSWVRIHTMLRRRTRAAIWRNLQPASVIWASIRPQPAIRRIVGTAY